MNLYERAARGKWRFNSSAGQINVEDLFDLPLVSSKKSGTDLQSVARLLHGAIQNLEPVFVNVTDGAGIDVERNELEAKMELVKHVIADKQTRLKAADEASKKAAMRQRVMSILEKKDDEELAGKSREELLALL